MIRDRRRLVLGAAVAISVISLLGGCQAQPGFDGVPDATSEHDGIRVELWSERSARAGDRVYARVRVTNLGDLDVTHETNDCPWGPARTVMLAPNEMIGREWTGLARTFKQLVLSDSGFGIGEVQVGDFVDIAYATESSCPAASRLGPLRPGEAIERTLVWGGRPKPGLPSPNGRVKIKAAFTSSADVVVAETNVEIASADQSLGLGLVDYVDAALSSSEFTAWLNEEPETSWVNPSVLYWPNSNGEYPRVPAYDGVSGSVVEIGLFRDVTGSSQFGAAIVDQRTGTVVAVRVDQ